MGYFDNPLQTLGTAVGQAAGGIPGSMIGNQVGAGLNNSMQTLQYSQPAMTPQMSGLLNQTQLQNTKSGGELTGDIWNGTEKANQIQDVSAQQNQSNAALGGGGMPGMQTAINNRALKNFNQEAGARYQNASQLGTQMAMHNTNIAAQNAVNIANIQRGIDVKTDALSIQAQMAKYEVIAGLMSGAGSFAGTAAGAMGGGGGAAVAADSMASAGSTPSAFNSGGQNYSYSMQDPNAGLYTNNQMGNYGLNYSGGY